MDLALRVDRPTEVTEESSSHSKRDMEKWERLNRISLMVMKCAIPETFRGIMSEDIVTAKDFLTDFEKRFTKNEKTETSTILTNLISREYIMEMSHLGSKLKALKLEFF